MIIKHVPMRTLGKSDFGGLVGYITDAQSKDHRLGMVQVTNCEAATVPAAIEEILATQHMNTRAKGDKTYHLIVSFRAGEQPDEATLKGIEERICSGLGYGEHQRVSAVHNDTDNLHIHIAINKIHPTRNTMHEPFQSYRLLGELCSILEQDYGLEQDNHQPRRTQSEARVADMEQHSGMESLVGWVKRQCLEDIRSSTSWAELHQVMRDNGLVLRERGNGLVVEASDGTMVKASTIARDLSKRALEARIGPFQASSEMHASKPKRSYQKAPMPMRIDTTELYARYKNEQKNLALARSDALSSARLRKDRANDQRGLQAALRMAAERYGSRITVTGDAEFKARIIHAAVDGRLSITFADPGLERRRQELLQPRSKSKGSVASLRSRVSPIGQQPPPQRRNQLHSLGRLPVLHIAASEQVMQPQAPQAPSPAETIALRQAKLRAEQAAKKAKRQGKGRAR